MRTNRIDCKDLGNSVAINTSTGIYFLNKENIYIKARSRKDRTLCWYFHPIYKELTSVEYRIVKGRPEFYLPAEELIDFEALKAFVSSENFKNKQYAFINYKLFEKLAA